MSEPIGGIYIPANSLTPEEMREFLVAYVNSPLGRPHVQDHGTARCDVHARARGANQGNG